MDLLSLLAVFGLGAVELWAAVPTGLALKLHPITTGITAALGALAGILAVVWIGERVRTWLVQRYGGGSGRVAGVWTRFGVVGLGLLAPLLVGAPLGTALGMALGAPTGRLLFWMSLGAVLCTVSLTLAGTLGLLALASFWH